MSYHNGSVWPHDNSLIAAGFTRYDLRESTATVLAGLLDASLFLDLHRLPELFCGFPETCWRGANALPCSVRSSILGIGRCVSSCSKLAWA